MRTIGLTGIGGGKLKDMVDLAIVVPSNSMQHTEDVHLIINHLLTAFLRDETKAPPS
jgi:D-sedoheptulose 7-phosphate isomerase